MTHEEKVTAALEKLTPEHNWHHTTVFREEAYLLAEEVRKLRTDRHEAWEALEDILMHEPDSFTNAALIARRGLTRKRHVK